MLHLKRYEIDVDGNVTNEFKGNEILGNLKKMTIVISNVWIHNKRTEKGIIE